MRRSSTVPPPVISAWPPVERTMTTQKGYPVVLYDEV